jgi:hypothetical protein
VHRESKFLLQHFVFRRLPLILNVELLNIHRHHIAAHVLTWLEDRLEVLVWHMEVTNSNKGFAVKQTQTPDYVESINTKIKRETEVNKSE